MRAALVTLVALVAVLAAACGGASAPPPALSNTASGPAAAAHEPLATIERTACFGWCPVYKVTIFRDGALDYEGKRYVRTKGPASGHLSPEQIAALDALFQNSRYLDFKDAYQEHSMTDSPSTYTSYTPAGGKPKSVKHYHGDATAPKQLGAVEDGIDRIIEIEQWIGSDEERRKMKRE